MDFTVLMDYLVLVVVVACLILGYLIKHATFMKWLPNDDIPVVLAAVGAVLNIFVSGLSIESVVFGAFMGLASTGLHQAFTRFIDGLSNAIDDNDGVDE